MIFQIICLKWPTWLSIQASDSDNEILDIDGRFSSCLSQRLVPSRVVPAARLILESQGFSERNPECTDLGSYFGGSNVGILLQNSLIVCGLCHLDPTLLPY
jgi:hypothetical protein